MHRFKSRITRFSTQWITALTLGMALCLSAGSAFAFDFDVKDTKVTIGGYLKVMANYDFNGTQNNNLNHPTDGDIVGGYDSPLDGTPYDDKKSFSMTARESRLFVKTASPGNFGLVSTHLEGDFNSEVGGSPTWSNSRAFRLRHAYGSIKMGNNTLVAGQTWSTMMDYFSAVPAMDISSDPGVVFLRQPQIKLQHNFDRGHYFAVAAENPARGLTVNGDGPQLVNPESTSSLTMPDFVFKYFWSTGNFHISPAVVVRQFELDDEKTFAWGSSLTGHVGFGNGHKVYATFLYGDGMGRYGGLGHTTGAGLTASGDIETVGYMGYNTGVTFKLRDNLAWTLGCGYAENDEDAYTGSDAVLSGNAAKEVFQWHTNLMYQITPSLEYAIGFLSSNREVMDGREGDMMRVQNYLKFSF